MSITLDASVTLAWLFDDEASPDLHHLFEAIAERGAVVPALWWLEVANSLTTAVRRNRIDANFRQAALRDLAVLDITTDPQTAAQAWSDTISLADQYRLTVHDAAYLELARRRGLPLATLDADLRAAALKAAIPLAPR